jgi:hypothetical protein
MKVTAFRMRGASWKYALAAVWISTGLREFSICADSTSTAASGNSEFNHWSAILDGFKPESETKPDAHPRPHPRPRPAKPDPNFQPPDPNSPNRYLGTIGEAQIDLTWLPKEEITGTFFLLRDRTKQYTIKGNLGPGGESATTLTANFSYGDQPIGSAKLRKTAGRQKTDKFVVWEGDFVDQSGQPEPMQILRSRKIPSTIAIPTSVADFEAFSEKGFHRYEGAVIDQKGVVTKSIFKLSIDGEWRTVQGFYYELDPVKKTPSPIMRLDGCNLRSHGLILQEFQPNAGPGGDTLSAELSLTKDLKTKKEIRWTGTMTNINGPTVEEKRVWFARPAGPE